MERVLVIFQATEADTESLALAFALGAVEGGALIRLRHLSGDAAPSFAHQGYGPPKPTDLAWAELIALVLESGSPAPSLAPFFQELKDSSAFLAGEIRFAYIVGPAEHAPCISLTEQTFRELGFTLLDSGANPTPASVQAAAKLAVTS